jgi:NadR type nicotinamide-nucleotide adenylyltransferase
VTVDRPPAAGRRPPSAATARIVLTGSECTGKTSLATFLGEKLHVPVVPEYARAYAEGAGRPLGPDDVDAIARGHMLAADAVLQANAPLAVLDTDLVSTVVYAEHYYGSVAPWIVREAQVRLGDLYLLCDIDLPWVPDGVRDLPHLRPQVDARFREQLERLNAHVVTVRGLGDDRKASALAAVVGWRRARDGA